MTKGTNTKTVWRSLASRAGLLRDENAEFPAGAEIVEMDGVSRRHFMGIMGASIALAGAEGCVRKPEQEILPYNHRPEDQIDGKARHFATSLFVGGSVLGVLVKSQDGRPSKVEGNPNHPSSLGSTSVWAQAAVLDVFDNDRSQSALHAGAAVSMDEAWAAVEAAAARGRGNGDGIGLVISSKPSPTLGAWVKKFQKELPQARVFIHDLAQPANTLGGANLAGAGTARPVFDLSKAQVIVSLDADFMGTGVDATRLARQFAAGRSLEGGDRKMNRLYAVESLFTVTGSNADNRLQIPTSQVATFARLLAKEVLAAGATAPTGGEAIASALNAQGDERLTKWSKTVAADLKTAGANAVVLVGERQPAWVHALGHFINAALGAVGNTVAFIADTIGVQAGGTDDLAQALDQGKLKTLFMVDVNPAYDGPGAAKLGEKLQKVESSFHFGYHPDETAQLATWHLPLSHQLETWGDLVSWDGIPSVQQPLIAPLYDSVSDIEAVARITSGKPAKSYDLVRENWQQAYPGPAFDLEWRRWVHAGLRNVPDPTATPTWAWSAVAAELSKAAAAAVPTQGAIEVTFVLDNKTYDGRYANNAWLQELPDPITKITWDNAALVGPATARQLGIQSGSAEATGRESTDLINIEVDGRSMTIAAFVTPGVAENCIALPLGYGRDFKASVAKGLGPQHQAGFNTHALRATAAGFVLPGAKVSKTGQTYLIATTQDHGRMRGDTVLGGALQIEKHDRPIVRHTSLEEYDKNPGFVRELDLAEEQHLRSLWDEPNERDGNQWGMVINLTTCIGCNACTIACQAENNIPVVGKERVLNGRELHWIRLDRYFVGDDDQNPELVMQPMACAHCETAPCEQVCPVAATVHSVEGINEMVYNRCVGTRYCSNNCPYKVRRFNFFNYQKENDERNPLYRMQKSNDVTVRFRGVMEKCTYCIQRVNGAKIAAKVAGKDTGDFSIKDGAIVPACGQACPTQAITFGNINDPEAKVSKLKKLDRNYAVLEFLNIRPRTTYLAKIRNPNPELG